MVLCVRHNLLFKKSSFYPIINVVCTAKWIKQAQQKVPLMDHEKPKDIIMKRIKNEQEIPIENLEGFKKYEEEEGFNSKRKDRMNPPIMVIKKKMREKKFLGKGPLVPNLMTWFMKTNMRSLHECDPEKWTPDNLSKSFPISAESVRKVLKSEWKPANEKEMYLHDHNAACNWVIYANDKIGNYNVYMKTLEKKYDQLKSGYQSVAVADTNSVMFKESIDKLLESNRQRRFQVDAVIHPVYAKRRKSYTSFQSIITDYNSSEKQTNSISMVTEDIPKHLDMNITPELSTYFDEESSQNYVRVTSKFDPSIPKGCISYDDYIKNLNK